MGRLRYSTGLAGSDVYAVKTLSVAGFLKLRAPCGPRLRLRTTLLFGGQWL